MMLAAVATQEKHLKPLVQPAQSRMMTTLERNIHSENQSALMRRWDLVQSGEIERIRNVDQWFPCQRELLSFLAEVDRDEVLQMADCTMPLFSMRLPVADLEISTDGRYAKDAFEAACAKENFFALLDRVEARRTDAVQASILYDFQGISPKLWNHVPRELEAIGMESGVALVPCVTDDYFRFAVRSHMSCRDRSILAATHRRNRIA